MLTEKEKMIAGEIYDSSDPQLLAERARTRRAMKKYEEIWLKDPGKGILFLREFFGHLGEGVWIEPPFMCDYGEQIYMGDRVYFNFGCVVLDGCRVNIGDDVQFGPGVHIYTATHPLDYRLRRAMEENSIPVNIGSDVWIGGGTIICPGASIGSRSVIGAGSVVVKNIPEGVLAAGNPARVIRTLE